MEWNIIEAAEDSCVCMSGSRPRYKFTYGKSVLDSAYLARNHICFLCTFQENCNIYHVPVFYAVSLVQSFLIELLCFVKA